MTRLLALALALAAALPAAAETPRVISLNLCTDQLVLALADPGRIIGLSPFARDAARSSAAAEVGARPVLSGTAEEVLVLKVDIVVGGLYDRRATHDLIRRRGIRLETFDIPRSIAEARAQIARMGSLLGDGERAAALDRRIAAALQRLREAASRSGERILPWSRRGWVEGGGTLLGDVLKAAGLVNAADEAGLSAGGFVGLEALLRLKPDAILLAGAEARGEDQGSALLLHPAIEALYPPEKRLHLAESLTICGGPALARAMEALAGELERRRAAPRR